MYWYSYGENYIQHKGGDLSFSSPLPHRFFSFFLFKNAGPPHTPFFNPFFTPGRRSRAWAMKVVCFFFFNPSKADTLKVFQPFFFPSDGTTVGKKKAPPVNIMSSSFLLYIYIYATFSHVDF